jgi:hypothetical protein
MSIEEFLNIFNDIIPYKFQLKIGGMKSNVIISNKELISSQNRKGKSYPFYIKNLLGATTDYISLEKLDVPIELTIQCSHPHTLRWEKTSKSTNKERTYFQVRILSEDASRQLGYLSIDLTPAGDIDHKFCSFYNEDGTHEIMQSINYNYDEQAKKVTPTECLSFIFSNLETGLEEKISFHKEDGILKCITINKQGLKNHAFDSIVWSDDEVKEKNEFFSRFCNNARVEHATPLVCDMTNYIINKDFTGKLERIKDLQRILSYEHDPLFAHYDYDKIREEIALADPKNDIFSGFYGEYIGNTVIKLESKLILIIETLMDDYHYFTSVDITNTDAFDVDFYHERNDGTSYYQAIESSDKKPMFRVKNENGNEVLIPLGEQITDDEIRNFELFKSYCVEDFSTIESKKMATLSLDKYSSSERGQQLVKKYQR